ncbi:MAG: DNA-binding response regulator [Flavobacteriales bacterium]|nr:DNA-binding response regulator [Flavobacteriales bacterium]|tara:strand:- start:82 stop:819 length:738 start_codon:yes stop_codon:yes gene_type:complete
MNCLIVDDEPLAIDVIKKHVERIPFLNLTGTTTSAFEAIEVINSGDIDLLFLDIQMPELTGLELLNSLRKPPLVVFTTAYQDYALESYELDAVDYLMKPIPFDRLLKAVNKAKIRSGFSNKIPVSKLQEKKVSNAVEKSADFIFVKTAYKTVKIMLQDVCYIESQKDYVVFNLQNEKISSQLSLTYVESQLTSSNFIRIHRSFIVALDKIAEVERNTLIINGNRISVGANYRTKFKEVIGSQRLG